jgi:hypothetical protein
MAIQAHNLRYTEASTERIGVDGLFYAYRSVGDPADIPLVCLQHFTGTLDNWDPLVIDGLAQNKQVITIDNSGIGSSDGETPDNVSYLVGRSADVIGINSMMLINGTCMVLLPAILLTIPALYKLKATIHLPLVRNHSVKA